MPDDATVCRFCHYLTCAPNVLSERDRVSSAYHSVWTVRTILSSIKASCPCLAARPYATAPARYAAKCRIPTAMIVAIAPMTPPCTAFKLRVLGGLADDDVAQAVGTAVAAALAEALAWYSGELLVFVLPQKTVVPVAAKSPAVTNVTSAHCRSARQTRYHPPHRTCRFLFDNSVAV